MDWTTPPTWRLQDVDVSIVGMRPGGPFEFLDPVRAKCRELITRHSL